MGNRSEDVKIYKKAWYKARGKKKSFEREGQV